MGEFIPKATDGAILLSMSAGGSENDQIYLLDRANFTTTLLTDGKSRNRIDAIRDDGRQMIIGSNQRNGRDTDLYLADPRKPGSMKMLMEVSGEFWSAADWSPDGKRLLLVRYVSVNESYPAILDLETGERTDLPLPDQGEGRDRRVGVRAGRQVGLHRDRCRRASSGSSRGSTWRRGKYEWLTGDIPGT